MIVGQKILLSSLLLITIYASCSVYASRGCSLKKDGYMCKFSKTCGKSSASREGYIFQGSDVRPKEFPSFAQIKVYAEPGESKNDTICSGVIVSDRHVATAAHCLMRESEQISPSAVKPTKFANARNLLVFVGLHQSFKIFKRGTLKEKRVKSHCVNPKYTEDSLRTAGSDTAILTLEEPLEFDDYIQPACWPYDVDTIDLYNDQCYLVGIGLAGWNVFGEQGYDKPVVQKMQINALDCPRELGSEAVCFKGVNQHRKSSSCFGDSGGPALCFRSETKQWTVVGLVSRSYEEDSNFCSPGSRIVMGFPSEELDLAARDQWGCIEVRMDHYLKSGK